MSASRVVRRRGDARDARRPPELFRSSCIFSFVREALAERANQRPREDIALCRIDIAVAVDVKVLPGGLESGRQHSLGLFVVRLLPVLNYLAAGPGGPVFGEDFLVFYAVFALFLLVCVCVISFEEVFQVRFIQDGVAGDVELGDLRVVLRVEARERGHVAGEPGLPIHLQGVFLPLALVVTVPVFAGLALLEDQGLAY